MGDDNLRAAAAFFIDAVKHDSIKTLLTKPDGHVVAINEQTFAVRVPKGTDFASVSMDEETDLQGSIDRLVVFYGDDGKPTRADVIDWKTDAFDENERTQKIAHYEPQLASYRFAASKLLGLDPNLISTKLVLLHSGEIVETTTNKPCVAN